MSPLAIFMIFLNWPTLNLAHFGIGKNQTISDKPDRVKEASKENK